jgi:transposase
MEHVTLDRHRQHQARILSQLLAGKITTKEAAASLSLSVRWVERMRPAFREQGPAALVHGNTGRSPRNALPPEFRQMIQALARDTYAGLNFQHFTEKLGEVEGIQVSPRSVHRICREADITPPRPQKRRSVHRRRRPRCARAGELLQLDGSPHDWLEGRGPRLTLITHIDDATSFKWASFREGEDLEGYMRVFQTVVEERGIPGAIYSDRTVIVAGASRRFKPHQDRPDIPSQFRRALDELGVAVILANSPQAKGRVERSHGVDQDRLVSELRLAGAGTLEQANTVLVKHLQDVNRRFGVPPKDPTPAWRPRPSTDLREIFCLKEQRVVAKDNTVRVFGDIIDIPPGPHRRSYADTRVLVHRRYDRTVGIFLDGVRIGGSPPLPRSRSLSVLPTLAR